MGHRDLLVTRTYLRQTPNARVCPREESAGRLSSSGVTGNWLSRRVGWFTWPSHARRVEVTVPCDSRETVFLTTAGEFTGELLFSACLRTPLAPCGIIRACHSTSRRWASPNATAACTR